MESDIECYHWLLGCGLNVQIILTKADKLSKNAAMAQQNTMRSELINRIMTALENHR